MKKTLLSTVAIVTASLLAAQAKAQSMTGITNTNSVFTMASVSSPSTISGPYAVSGVATGQTLVGIDSRPGTGDMYALGYDSLTTTAQLYRITHSGTTYTASAVGSSTTGINLGSTNNGSFKFISTMDNQIRITGRNGNNYVMDGNTGSVLSTGSTSMGFGVGDIYVGLGAQMAASAYTNSFYGSDATQQVGFDATNNVLVTTDAGTFANGFNNASTVMHSIGVGTGLALNTAGSIGMDTWYDTITHNNTMFMTGATLLTGTHLYKYDMTSGTGSMTDLGVLGSGSLWVRDIAMDNGTTTSTSVSGKLVTALSLNLRRLVTFDSKNPGTIRTSKTLSGMTAGQTMVAIDFSASGSLYGLGYNSTAQTYQLYTIDTATGNVSAVNSSANSLALGTDDGSGNNINVGFRFVPTLTNRIRIIGKNGATNGMMDATTGTMVSTDAALSYVTGDANFGGTANITSVGYTGYNGDGTTQMFGYDANTGDMVKFNTTNSTSGYGDGGSGFISTDANLNTVLNLFGHSSSYNNSFMDIAYDATTSSNIGLMVANYNGTGADQQNYSIMYDMTAMLTGYGKGTAATPTEVGRVGYGTPVKDAVLRNANAATTGFATTTAATNALQVYPNPVASNTRIVLPAPSIGAVNVTIIDMNGAVLREYTFAPGTLNLDVDMTRFPSGLYSVRVGGDAATPYNLKVVKE